MLVVSVPTKVQILFMHCVSYNYVRRIAGSDPGFWEGVKERRESGGLEKPLQKGLKLGFLGSIV